MAEEPTVECWSASCQIDNAGNRSEVYLQPFRVGLDGASALMTAPVFQAVMTARYVSVINWVTEIYTVQALGFIEAEALDCLYEGLEGDVAAQARRFRSLPGVLEAAG